MEDAFQERTPSPAEWDGEAPERDILRLVLEIFPEARWTTREEYRRLARLRHPPRGRGRIHAAAPRVLRDHQARRRRA
jgi:hypothetical protein